MMSSGYVRQNRANVSLNDVVASGATGRAMSLNRFATSDRVAGKPV